MSRLSVIAVGLMGGAAIACGPSGRGPEAPPAASANALVPVEEQALASAAEKKRAGDPIGAWALLENIPASSPSRFDPRYTEVMSAWADARTRQLGVEIAGSKGGGPAVGSVEADDPPHALSTDKIEGIVASKRSRLRDACFGEGTKSTSFVLDLKIDPEGKVLEAKTSAVKGEPLVAECVQSHAQSWTFPKNPDGAAHKTKFIFAR